MSAGGLYSGFPEFSALLTDLERTLEAGDVVLTSPFTFASTAEVVRYFNAVPMFVDIQADTLNMDPSALTIVIVCTAKDFADKLRQLPGVSEVIVHPYDKPWQIR